MEDPQEEAIHRLTLRLGLVPVGWIFTDLVADDLTTGTVKNFRGNVVCYCNICCITTKKRRPISDSFINFIY